MHNNTRPPSLGPAKSSVQSPVQDSPHYTGEAKSPALDLRTLHNPYAARVTEELSKLIAPTPSKAPQGRSENLHETIASHEGLEPDNVFLANGLWHMLHHFFTSLAPREVCLLGPLPPEYYHSLELLNIPFKQVPLLADDDFQASPQALQSLWETQADLIIVSTPNMLTGASFASLQAIFSMIRAPRVLIDASLQEFLYPSSQYHSQRYTACLHYLRPGIALFMLNNFMPFFACPGLCLTYLLGDKHPLAVLKRHMPPYMTATYTQILGERLFQRIDDYRATLPKLAADRVNTAITLRRSPLFHPDYVFEGPSFVCAALKNPKSAPLVLEKLHKHHIGVLPVPHATGIPSGFIRMSATNDENLPYVERTLAAIADEMYSFPL